MIPVSEQEAEKEMTFAAAILKKTLQSLLREKPDTYESKIEENENL